MRLPSFFPQIAACIFSPLLFSAETRPEKGIIVAIPAKITYNKILFYTLCCLSQKRDTKETA